MIAHRSRPLDVIGYFSNDELFLKIDEQTGKLERIKSYNAAGQDDGDDDCEDDKDEKLITTQNVRKEENDYGLKQEDERKEVEMAPIMNSVIDAMRDENDDFENLDI